MASDAHPDVIRPGQEVELIRVTDGDGGQGALADQDRMDELNRVVLSIAEGRSGAGIDDQLAPAMEALGHPPAGGRQLRRSGLEKVSTCVQDGIVVPPNRSRHRHRTATHACPRERPPSLAGTRWLAYGSKPAARRPAQQDSSSRRFWKQPPESATRRTPARWQAETTALATELWKMAASRPIGSVRLRRSSSANSRRFSSSSTSITSSTSGSLAASSRAAASPS